MLQHYIFGRTVQSTVYNVYSQQSGSVLFSNSERVNIFMTRLCLLIVFMCYIVIPWKHILISVVQVDTLWKPY